MLLRANALAKGYSGARIETVELLARVPQPRRPAARARAAARSARAATSRRSRTSRCRSSAKARRAVDGRAAPGAEALARGRARAGPAAGEGGALARSTARSSWPRSARSALVRAQRLAQDRRHRVRALARGAAGVAHELPPADPRAAAAARARASRRRTSCGCSRARRSTSPTAGATRCRTPTRCAARRRCTAPRATCSTTSTATVAVELNAATDNPLVLVEDEMLVSNGNFHGQPLAFALDALAMAVAELANISERRVERLVNPNLSGGLPRVPDARRRAQLRAS